MCADAGFDAVIVTKEGGGNADADMALKMDALEDLGITAVGLFAEMSGIDGTGPPIVVPPERATAMVSTGNYDHRLSLPAVERAYGGERVALVDQPRHRRHGAAHRRHLLLAQLPRVGRLTCRAGSI